MKFLDEVDVKDKKVVLRIDANIPVNESGEITNLTGLYRRVAPSLNYLLKHQASVILLASNSSVKSLQIIAQKLSAHFKTEVEYCPNLGSIREKCAGLRPGQIIILENLANVTEEKHCDQQFAKELAGLGDIYVSDTFSEAVQACASTTLALSYAKTSCAGLLLKTELDYYDRSVVNPKRPFCVIVGGAVAAPRIDVLRYMVQKADVFLVGGAIANTFLAAQGAQMGRSLIERDLFPKIMEFIGMLARRDSKVYFPVDFRASDSLKVQGLARAVTAQEVPADSMVLDIGPATSILYEEAITNAETILWNGPMGAIEKEEFSQGTTQLIQSLASAHGLTVAGGVATEAAIHNMELEHRFDHLSTGGQAFLDMMQGRKLPGLVALGL